jgi:hypothetical protein
MSATGDEKPTPRLRVPKRPLALPEIQRMREVRRALAFGGLTPAARRTPEDNARIASFRTLEELLPFLDEYRRRIESGQRCRLVEREHTREPGRLLVEWVIEVQS